MDIEIPYNVETHPETGLYNAKLGVWLFLASEVMLFGALFSAYILLRTGATDWPVASEILNVPLATLNTFILISSSVTVVMAWASLELKNFKRYRTFMGLTILLSFGFLIVKAIEYGTKFSHHLYPSENNFLAVYFVLTGLHGLHVIGGIVVMAYLWGPGAKMWKTEPLRFTHRVEVAGLYWHFVDLVWIFLFPTIYLI